MIQSPFAFFRGAALNMAADLASTPTSGPHVQLCGDCHVMNFGGFASAERRLVFDINDFDETLPGPWEWDVKRLATSFVLACRHNGFSADASRDAALACVRSYRQQTHLFSQMHVLDIWYARIDLEEIAAHVDDEATRKRIQKVLATTSAPPSKEHLHPRLAQVDQKTRRIHDAPPWIYHLPEKEHAAFADSLLDAFATYRGSVQDDRRVLLDRFQVCDMAIKVVGVGSVGTWCAVILLIAEDDDPLFLQVKEARPSVLEAFLGKSAYNNRGQRVVNGCRLMQAASDPFLGWTHIKGGHHFYVRQLKNMKVHPYVETYAPSVMNGYAEVCGRALARAHARAGDPVIVSGYLGKSDVFEESIASFAVAYADQTERDHAMLMQAVQAGRVPVVLEGP